ncbi:hypothetical protein HN958_02235 [Candidatus Falkowbacteria bacterium]|nr:hypothetical protein [Candidatus Falkowbacteria bacterium]
MATNLQKIGSCFRSRLRRFICFGLKRKKINLGLIVGAVFLFGFILFLPTKSHAFMESLQEVSDGIVFVVNWLLFYFVQAIGWLVMKVFGLIIMVAGYNEFVSHPAIAKGWYLMRDLCNMFFILILLVIAFSTILRVEKYEIKKMLPTLVISAVLVNFSKLICSLIIDFGQVVMMTFVNGFTATAGGNLMVGLGIENIFALQSGANSVGVDQITYFVTLILGAVMMLVTLWVVVSMLVLLVIRIVTLWFLVVTSPLAFLLKIMPFTSKHYNEWWQKFGWNVAIGPVFAFFLWLSLLIMSNPTAMFDFPMDSGTVGGPVQPKAGLYGNLGQFVIAIGLLWAVFTASKEAGGAISSIGGKLASTGMGIGKSAVMRRLGGNYLKGAVDKFTERGKAKDKKQQNSGALLGDRAYQGTELMSAGLKKAPALLTGVARNLTIGLPGAIQRSADKGSLIYDKSRKEGKNMVVSRIKGIGAELREFVRPTVEEVRETGRGNLNSKRMIGGEIQAAKNKEAVESLNNSGYDLENKDDLRSILDDKTRTREEKGIAYQKLAEEGGMGNHTQVKAGRKTLANNKEALKAFNEAVEKKQLHMAYDFTDDADIKKYQGKVKADKIDVTKISDKTAEDANWQKATLGALGADTYAKKMSKVRDRSESHAKAVDSGAKAMMKTQMKNLKKEHDAASPADQPAVETKMDELRNAMATITLDMSEAYSDRNSNGEIVTTASGAPSYTGTGPTGGKLDLAVKFINKASGKQLGDSKIDASLLSERGYEIQEAAIHRMASSTGKHGAENANAVAKKLYAIHSGAAAPPGGVMSPAFAADLKAKIKDLVQNNRTVAEFEDDVKKDLKSV